MRTSNSLFFLLLIVLLSATIAAPKGLQAQAVWENSSSNVYPFLDRLAQKGLTNFSDIIRPCTRVQITNSLLELVAKKNQLSSIETKELDFYLQEFQVVVPSNNEQVQFIKKDNNHRLRGLFVHTKDFELNADPIGSLLSVSSAGKQLTQMSNGLQFWGQSKGFAFQFYYRDYTETGKGIDSFRIESPEPGIIKLYNPSATNQNFSEIRAHLSYAWKKGSISIGKDQLLWGYGENGLMVLSNKAPSYPFIRFDYQPLKWLSFNYTHAWLNSNIIDSSASYGTNSGGVSGNMRIRYVPKFMATHSLIFKPTKGLEIAIGESIVYSDKLDVGFLIPLNFFKIYDNNRSNYSINAGSNGQFFLQASSRNQLKNTHLYGSLFIDELRVADMFNKAKSRNQLGYTLGGSITDIGLKYLTLGTDYTRVNPFVYSNLLPAQNYTQYNLPLGDWMGNNFDRITVFGKYTPLPKLRLYARYQHIRKGGAGTLAQQYLAVPQPAFLFDYQKARTDYFVQASYELINNFHLRASYQYLKQYPATGPTTNSSSLQMGVSYGL